MFDLKTYRSSLALTQTQMAEGMGMPLRSYQDIEAGRNPVRPVHEAAAKYVGYVVKTKNRVTGIRPLHFFMARFRKLGGAWSNCWTVYAEDFSEATERFYTLATVDRSDEINIKRAFDKGSLLPHHDVKYAAAVLEHQNCPWPE